MVILTYLNHIELVTQLIIVVVLATQLINLNIYTKTNTKQRFGRIFTDKKTKNHLIEK